MRFRFPYTLAFILCHFGCGSPQSNARGTGAIVPADSSTSDVEDTGIPSDTKDTPAIPIQDVEPVVQKPPISIPKGRLYDGFIVGGVPSREQIDAALVADIDSAMSLMASGEGQGDVIAGYATSKGFRYLHFAIDGIEALNEATAWEFAATLSMVDKPAIIHSQEGRRVGAIFALMAFFVDELPAEEAYKIGVAAGMGDYSVHVREVLGMPTQ